MSEPRPLLVEMLIDIKFYDVDIAGIVHNAVYIRWIEDLRFLLLATYYPFERCMQEGISPVLLQTHIEYKRPLKMFDKPIGRLWVPKFEGVRWFVDVELVMDNRVMTVAGQQGIFIKIATGRPVPMPHDLVKAFLDAS